MMEYNLKAVLPAEHIKLNVEVDTWQDAVREAGKLLLDTGAIRPGYIDAMIQTAEELGAYIVIAEGIAMPHAMPEAGVNRTAFSLVKLDPPIAFGNPDNDPVELVIGLACKDAETHVNAIRSLAELIMDKERIARLFQAQTVQQVLDTIA